MESNKLYTQLSFFVWIAVVLVALSGLASGPVKVLAVQGAPSVQAAPADQAGLSLTVDSTLDAVDSIPGDGVCAASGGECTLRAAIMEANELSGEDTVIIPAGIYTLTLPGRGDDACLSGDLDILGDLILQGAGAEATIIDGNQLDRVFEAPVSYTDQYNLTVIGLTVRNGDSGEAPGVDGIMFNGKNLVVRDCVIEQNTGAGIRAAGLAFSVPLPQFLLENSVVRENSGSNPSVSSSIIDIIVRNSTISNNSGVGIYADTRLTLLGSTVYGNKNGGVRAVGGGEIVNSTISNNDGTEGAGIWTNQGLGIYNSTITMNYADGNGGGIYFYGEGNTTISNTLLAGNYSSEGSADCYGPITSGGYNLVSDTTGCTFTSTVGDQLNADPLVDLLWDNGGPTLTYALWPSSPAIDAGNPAGCRDQDGNLLTLDQRGHPRPQDGDGDGYTACDIGAVEIDQPLVLTVNSTVDAVDALPGDGVCATSSGECTLRAAAMESSDSLGSDTIILPAGAYSLTLTEGEGYGAAGGLFLNGRVALQGSGAETTIVDGNLIGDLYIQNNSPLEATISGVTIRNGLGGIVGMGYLSIYDSQVIDNQGPGIWWTGIFFGGKLSVVRSTVSGNTSPGYVGGIRLNMGYLEVIDSTVSNNTGGWGGISADTGFFMSSSTVSGNTGTSGPGGMRIVGGGTIVNSTISGNAGTEGAGVWAGDGTEIYNSTITLNSATAVSDTMFLSGNGGGIYYGGEGGITLSNTMLAGNTSSAGSADCYGRITSGGYNQVGDTTGCTFYPTTGDQLNVDAFLGPLQDNGGSTFTHALLPSSSAVDAGNPAGCRDQDGNLLSVDQRGRLRPQDGNADGDAVCDIGAYEASPHEISSRWMCWDPGNPNPCHNNLYSVAVVDANNAWAVGQAGMVLHWNGGDWQQSPAPTLSDLSAVAMVTAEDGWAAGGKFTPGSGSSIFQGAMLHWDGAAWTNAYGDFSDAYFAGVDLVTSTDGWAIANGMGGMGMFWRWDGITWTVQLSQTSGLSAVDMLSAMDGWAVGESIWRWDGYSWTEIPISNTLNDLQMLSATDGWAVGYSGTILHWDGFNWSPVTAPATITLQTVAMQSVSSGWAIGWDPSWNSVMLRWDGYTWEQVPHPLPGVGLYGAAFIPSSAGWMVGQAGAILRWDGSAWTETVLPLTTQNLSGLDILTGQDGWAVGANGVKLHWDGGAWSVVDAGQDSGEQLKAVAVISSSEAWAVGEDDAFGCVISTWYGTAWQPFGCPSEASTLLSVDMVSSGDGWAAGWDTLLRWNGANWLPYTAPVSDGFVWRSLDVLDANDAWAVGGHGDYGAILHWDGTAWQISTEFTQTVTGLSMLSPEEGWAAAIYPAVFLHYHDGQWTAYQAPTELPVADISMVSSNNAWAVIGMPYYRKGGGPMSGAGTILHWDGSTWKVADHPSDQWISSVDMASESDGWAVGSNGVILRFQGAQPLQNLYLPVIQR